MKTIILGKKKILQSSLDERYDVNYRIAEIFICFEDLLPDRPDALILLKPNLNNDLVALTGTTTDLRVIIAIIKELKSRGYHNLIIGDGSNCGVFHSGINTFKRLGIDRIAKIFGLKYIDFNYANRKEVTLSSNSAHVANTAIDCDFFINIPKIKTHTEATLSLCCKNLVGCFTGYEKRNIHSKFYHNIYLLPKIFSPQLHIVDGLIAMEGNGPGAGRPIQLNQMFAATNPYLLDAYIAQLLGIPFRKIGYLKIACDQGDISPQEMEKLDMISKEFTILMPEIIAWKNLLLSNWFVKPRYWKIFDWMFNISFVDCLLLSLKIRQDIYITSKAQSQGILIDHNQCPKGCHLCERFCPMGNHLSDASFQPNSKNCIHCLYCYFICRNSAIKLKGELEYLKNHEQRYKKLIEGL